MGWSLGGLRLLPTDEIRGSFQKAGCVQTLIMLNLSKESIVTIVTPLTPQGSYTVFPLINVPSLITEPLRLWQNADEANPDTCHFSQQS